MSISLDSVRELYTGRHEDPDQPGWIIRLVWMFFVLSRSKGNLVMLRVVSVCIIGFYARGSGWSGHSLYCERVILSCAESYGPVPYWMLYTDRPRGFRSALCAYSGGSGHSLSLYVHVSTLSCWVVCYILADGAGLDRPELMLGLIWACIVPICLKGIL